MELPVVTWAVALCVEQEQGGCFERASYFSEAYANAPEVSVQALRVPGWQERLSEAVGLLWGGWFQTAPVQRASVHSANGEGG